MPVDLLQPALEHQVQCSGQRKVSQCAFTAFPTRPKADLNTLQALDPVTAPLLPFWRREQRPDHNERAYLLKEALELL